MQRDGSSASRHTGDGPRPIAECGTFAALARRAGELDALDRALRQVLSQPLREQVRFAQRRGDRLVFLATTPAWASRLRLQQTPILAAARAIGVKAAAVLVKVAPLPPVPAWTASSKPLAAAARRHLRAAATSTQDPELRALFLALATAPASDEAAS